MRRAAVVRILWLSLLTSALLPAVALAGSERLGRSLSNGTHIGTTTYNQNTTWTTAGSPYVLDGNITVASGVILTINPGVIVKFNGQLRELVISGTLTAVGASGNQIIFTSVKDDTVGGDSNGDGGITTPAAGDWYRIRISAGTASELRHVKVRYGGYGTSNTQFGAIRVENASTQLAVGNAEFTQNQRSAIYVTDGGATVSASTISQNANGISVLQGWVKVKDRTFITNNSDTGLWFNYLSTYSGTTSSITDSDVSQNTSKGIYINAATTLPAAKHPYGNRNNIYENGGGSTAAKQLDGPNRRWDVDWTGNYWGSDIYFWKASGLCLGVADESYGHLSYRWSTPAPGPGGVPTPPDGPMPHVNYAAGQGNDAALCPRDRFKIWPIQFSPYYLGGSQPALADGQALGCGGSRNMRIVLSVCTSDPVNSATGNFAHSVSDLSLPGTGVTFDFTRAYNSLDTTGGPLGQGWTHNHAASLELKASGDIGFRDGDGQRFDYVKQADGSFTAPAGALSTLASVTGGYELTRSDQVKYRFDTNGRLTSIKDRNNQGLTYAYDGSNRLSTITDAAGRVINLTYDANSKLTQVSVPDGRSVSFAYTSGRLSSVTDVRSKVWTYAYEAKGLLEKETDPLNHVVFRNVYGQDGRVAEQYDALNNKTTFAWDYQTQTQTVTDARSKVWKDVYESNVLEKRIDALNNQTQFGHNGSLDETSTTAPDGTVVTMTYDTKGNVLTASVPALNATKTFTYDSQNNVTSVTDARGKVTTYGHDASGNNTSIVQDGTTVATYTYNASGQRLTFTDGRNSQTVFTYDANANLVSETDPLGNKATYGYDAAGRMTSKVMPRGNVQGADPNQFKWTYTYNAAGLQLTESDPLGNTTTYGYDDAGNQTTVTDARNKTTTSAYDAADRIISVTAPDTGVTSYTYDAVGNRLTETNPRGKTTTSTYDANNRLASETSPLGNKTTYFYDASGNLTKVVEPRGNVQGANPDDYDTLYTYDAAGRLLSETDPLGNATSFVYDTVGNQTSVTDALSHTTSYAYDGRNRLTSVTAPGGAVTSYTYDANGNLLTRTDPNNHVRSYVYNAADRRTSMTLPLSHQWTYGYDADGNQTSQVDANGNSTPTPGDGTTSYTLDRAGRLTAIDYSDSTPDVSFAYDAVGNRTSMTDGQGTQTSTYDNVSRLASVTRGGDTFSYVYDLAGNVTRRTYADSTVVDYSYDDDSRLSSVASAGQTTSYVYDAAANLVQTTLPSANGYIEERAYDRAGRVTRVKANKGASVLADFTYTLDAVGNPTQAVRAGALAETQTYEYDVRDRLTQVCYAASCPAADYIRWTYDPVGNRLTEQRPSGTTNYTYNAADELTQAGSTSYSYDQNGNETQAGSRSFSYDLANQVISTTASGSTINYTHDGDGKRTQVAAGGQITKHLWDTNYELPQLALERDGQGALIRRYLYGLHRTSMATPAGDFYYHVDRLGSVANVTDAMGDTQWTYSYEPFGANRAETLGEVGAPENPMRFAGELLDSTGLYHMRARHYDPNLGRFLSTDPLETALSTSAVSSYSYVANRPTALVDPSGMCALQLDTTSQLLVEQVSSSSPPYDYGNCDAIGTRNPNGFVEVQVAKRGKGVDRKGDKYVSYEVFVRPPAKYRKWATEYQVDLHGTRPNGTEGRLDRQTRRPPKRGAHATVRVRPGTELLIEGYVRYKDLVVAEVPGLQAYLTLARLGKPGYGRGLTCTAAK